MADCGMTRSTLGSRPRYSPSGPSRFRVTRSACQPLLYIAARAASCRCCMRARMTCGGGAGSAVLPGCHVKGVLELHRSARSRDAALGTRAASNYNSSK